MAGGGGPVDIDMDAGRLGRGLDLDVAGVLDFRQGRLDLSRRRFQRVGVGAVDVDGDGGGFTGQTFADTVPEKGQDLGLQAGIGVEHGVDLRLDLVLLGTGQIGFQLDMELALFGAPGVFAAFGTADLLLDRGDAVDAQQVAGNRLAVAAHDRQGCAGLGGDAQDEMAFLERRQKFDGKKEQAGDGGDADQARDGE